jgi:hypothetical protein
MLDSNLRMTHPSNKAEEQAGGEDNLLQLLVGHEPQDGVLQNNTSMFRQAHNLHGAGERTKVWVLDKFLSEDDYREIKQKALQWYNSGKVFTYNLLQRDGTFNANEYNCAVFPKLLGINIPLDNGKVYEYTEKMIELGAIEWRPTHG